MTRILTVIFSIVFWCVGTSVILVIGPLFWILVLLRVVLAYAGMMLLHAIANRQLNASSKQLERGILWFPRTLLNLIGFLRRSISGAGSPSARPADETDEIVFQGEFVTDIASIISWLLWKLLPAVFIWVSIYFLLGYAGVELKGLFSEPGSWRYLLYWSIAWLAIGILAMLLIPVVRSVIVTPFVGLVAAIWAPLGLLFWVPYFSWAIVKYTYLLFRSALSGKIVDDPSQVLEDAIYYYIGGFNIILSVLFSDAPQVSATPDNGFIDDMRHIWPALRNRLLSLLAWPFLLFFLGFIGLFDLPWINPARHGEPVFRADTVSPTGRHGTSSPKPGTLECRNDNVVELVACEPSGQTCLSDDGQGYRAKPVIGNSGRPLPCLCRNGKSRIREDGTLRRC